MFRRKEENTISDGSIKIDIEVDGKQISVASKELDRLEESGLKSGKGVKAAESSMDSLDDKSAKAGSSVKGASSAIDGLGDSGAKAGKGLKGADGAIDGLADSSASASKGVKGVSDSLDGMAGKANEAASSAQRAKSETDGLGQQTTKATIGIKNLATSLGLVAIASAAFKTLKSSLDSAISRFDTLNTFPKVLQSLGVSAEESERSMSRLSDGIDGLPTTLNDIAASAQRMYTSFDDMDKATETAIALNNALLGSGSSADQAKRGTEQYIKALQTGTVDMNLWNTLSETMDVGLIKIAESFGFVGKTAKSDLYEALKYGSISLDEFNNKLIEVSTGTGIMAQLAKENTLGIATSFGNLVNSAARGVANIIDSFNTLTQEVTGKDIAQNIDSLKAVVNASFKVIGNVIEGVAPIVKVFASAIQATLPVIKALTPAMVGLASAYAIQAIIQATTTAIKANTVVMGIATTAKKLYTLAILESTSGYLSHIVATKASEVATKARSVVLTAATAVELLFTRQITLAQFALLAKAAAAKVLGGAIRFMMGPIGWITLAIGALVGAVIGIVKWFNRASAESKILNEKNEELKNSTEGLNSSLNESQETYGKNQTAVIANARANEKLAQRITELAEKENKSAAEKKLLQSHIEHLNGSVEGLNLAYNEEANALSMSSEQLLGRINLMKEQEKLIESENRLLEIEKEIYEVESKRDEVIALQDEWNQKKEEGAVKGKEYREAMAELEEQDQSLISTLDDLAVQQQITEQQMTSSAEAVTEAIQSGIRDQIISFDDLSEAQQETVESMREAWLSYKDAATDMFDTISDESTHTLGEMKKNLDENQKVVSEWAEGIATLAERGVDEGLLETLRQAGPESAGHVKELVKYSEEELKPLSEAFRQGADVATDAMVNGLGLEESGVMEAVGHIVTGAQMTLKQEIDSAQFDLIGTGLAEGVAEGVEAGTPQVEKASGDMMKGAEESAKKASEQNSPSKVFERIGDGLTEGLVLGVNNGSTLVMTTAKKLMVDFIAQFNDLPTKFEQIGKDAMAGFNRGLTAGEAQVLATARRIASSVASTIKQELDIHSPSRVTAELGKNTSEGLAKGMDDAKGAVDKSSKGLAKSAWGPVTNATTRAITNIMQDARKAGKSAKDGAARVKAEFDEAMKSSASKYELGTISIEQYIAALNAIEFEFAKNAEQRRKIAKTLKDTEEKYAKETFDASMDFIEERKYYNQMSLDQELVAYERMQTRYKAGTDEYKKLEREKYRVKKALEEEKLKLEKEAFDKSKAWIDERKYYNELSLAQELAAWERVHDTHINNVELRKQAERELHRVRKQMTEQIQKHEQDYARKSEEIRNRERADIKQLRDEYEKTFDARKKSLVSFAALFDEVTNKEEVSGQQLIKNLRGQVSTFEEWSSNIASLARRGINQGLLEELREMGPKAAAEIKALNSLTDDELTEYSNLFKQKNKLAQQQTEQELEKMKNTTDRQIKGIKENTRQELNGLYQEFIRQVERIRGDTTTEFTDMAEEMPDIGKSAMEGLKDGMLEKEDELVGAAKRIANKIKETISGAFSAPSVSLPNSSPSSSSGSSGSGNSAGRVGLPLAIATGSIVSAGKALSGIAAAKANNSASSKSTTNKTENNITINSPKVTTPSERAREIARLDRQLSMG